MFWSVVLSVLLTMVSVLLMFIILLQRGRGGGLAGALGGMGGQSAFGTKAGDVFTKITIGMALAWVLLAGITGMVMYHESSGRFPGGGNVSIESNASDDGDADGEPGGMINQQGDDTEKFDDTVADDGTSSGDDTPAGTDETPADDSGDKQPADDTNTDTE
jgi:preprotein translocase subunit SecG